MSNVPNHVTAASALGAALLTLAGWLPQLLGALASLFGLIWYAINICESKWFQRHWRGRKGRRYWDKYMCDQFDPRIAFQVFDAAYNGGHPAQWLQKAAGVTQDGNIGAQTVAAVQRSDPLKIIMRFMADRLDYWTNCGP